MSVYPENCCQKNKIIVKHFEVKTWFLDNRYPQKRKEMIEFWSELLLSASDQLVNAKYVDQKTVDVMKAEMSVVANDPNAVFFFSFIQAKARNGMF